MLFPGKNCPFWQTPNSYNFQWFQKVTNKKKNKQTNKQTNKKRTSAHFQNLSTSIFNFPPLPFQILPKFSLSSLSLFSWLVSKNFPVKNVRGHPFPPPVTPQGGGPRFCNSPELSLITSVRCIFAPFHIFLHRQK